MVLCLKFILATLFFFSYPRIFNKYKKYSLQHRLSEIQAKLKNHDDISQWLNTRTTNRQNLLLETLMHYNIVNMSNKC